ncbi:MAG: methyltransferase domain-containing protein [Anaerolineae bacterium]|nr:methyltransferase domain-containing protein [Anaerolineae bacterium]
MDAALNRAGAQGVGRRALMRALFASASLRDAAVGPILAPLHADFAAYAAPRPSDRALDLGSGSGGVARLIAPRVRSLAALDFLPDALALARQAVPGSAALVCGDIECPPFITGAFTLATASLALHATLPARSLPALRRALAPGGRLIIQEWGPADALHLALDDLLADHASESPPPALADLRAALASLPLLWGDLLQDVEDYREWLVEAGFEVERAEESAPVTVRIPSADAYLRFLLARPDRHAELDGMGEEARAAFLAAARAQMASAAGPGGSLRWAPVLLRVTARRR